MRYVVLRTDKDYVVLRTDKDYVVLRTDKDYVVLQTDKDYCVLRTRIPEHSKHGGKIDNFQGPFGDLNLVTK